MNQSINQQTKPKLKPKPKIQGYLLGFHFIFILCGFAAHGLRTGSIASLRIGSGFLAATAAVAAVQALPVARALLRALLLRLPPLLLAASQRSGPEASADARLPGGGDQHQVCASVACDDARRCVTGVIKRSTCARRCTAWSGKSTSRW